MTRNRLAKFKYINLWVWVYFCHFYLSHLSLVIKWVKRLLLEEGDWRFDLRQRYCALTWQHYTLKEIKEKYRCCLNNSTFFKWNSFKRTEFPVAWQRLRTGSKYPYNNIGRHCADCNLDLIVPAFRTAAYFGPYGWSLTCGVSMVAVLD